MATQPHGGGEGGLNPLGGKTELKERNKEHEQKMVEERKMEKE